VAKQSSDPRRIAAIDIGTNSIHMIVAEARGRNYRVVDREKDMVQLGLSSLDGQPLTDEAMARGVTSIAKMSQLAARWDVDEVVAVATSAVREAPNRRDFLRRVKDEAGINVRVISGEEEADLIFRAVRSTVDIGIGTALVVDIGGGSVEFIIGTSSEIYLTQSEPLGSLRLAQKFGLESRPFALALEQCREFVEDHLVKLRKRVRRLGVDLALGTSGTVVTLANLCSPADSTGHALRRVERDTLAALIPVLAGMGAKERAEQFGIDDRRSVTIVAGAVILHEIMRQVGIESMLACPVAIREGIVESRVSDLARSRKSGGSLRRRSVLALAARTDCDMRHGTHVARLARRIFDQTRKIHCLPDESLDLLEYAALLHECGLHISDKGHHKHSYYLIRHADLRGFTDDHLRIIANTARYYRKAAPSEADPNIAELTPEQKADVEKLVAILRIAEGFDRGHRQRVRDVAVRATRDTVQFIARTRVDAVFEVQSARKRSKYFASLFNVRVKFESV
jgi:exopolyphosphatase/guanosine-5'-triphosphate,3'-diphosphate pyrophosphatase